MNLQPTDLLIRKTDGTETLWLSQRLVMEVCEVSDGYLKFIRNHYKKSVRSCDLAKAKEFMPDSGKAWRWAKTSQGFYYCLDNIPDRAPKYYRSKFGTAEELKAMMNAMQETSLKTRNEDLKAMLKKQVKSLIKTEDIKYYEYDAPILFNPKKARELAKAKAWVEFIKNQYQNGSFKLLGLKRKQDFLSICTAILQELQLEGLKVSSPAYLRRKIELFPPSLLEQRDYLINERYDNDNARKVGKYPLYDEETGEVFQFDAHQALMYTLYMNPFGSSKEAIRQLYVNTYTDAIQEFGFEPIAYRTFCFHLAQFHKNMLMAKERHGKDYFKKQFLTYVPQKKLQYAHSLFAGDGSGTINYKYYDKEGKLNTMKLYVILISDVASRKIVGWSVAAKGSHKETSEIVAEAIKMAIKTCGYQTMFEFISDNHSAFTSKESKELLEMVFNKVRTIEVGNSQANPAETEFRLFKQSLKGLSNYTSTSWKVGIEGQSNPDYLNIEDLPTYEEAVVQFAEVVERWNAGKLRDGSTPNERFEYKNPKRTDIDGRIIRKIYGNQTSADISYMRGFVKVEKTKGYEHRESFLFEIPDYWGNSSELIAKATGYKRNAKVAIVWTEEMADLYTIDGKFIISCPPAVLAAASHAEADEESQNALGHHLKRKEQMEYAADEFTKNLTEIYQDLPYIHQMKAGGTKESYQGSNTQMENSQLSEKQIKRNRINRDFKL
ncbi:DDE-type integrase/transposase/recombinase [Riemerella anatipestifer]|uniref:DDE-type integrase/transposase/recombinase n=1 Tax=Riemerella anatipestifer TaxID=34085 RepID=UPI00129D29E9|nr:DDE-type integrase/transposase/recombinase [Riemerella anatipestifer]MRM84539.1 transposase [Riemerella anatipestifer]